jgi:thiamine biosynthesis lipoprotein
VRAFGTTATVAVTEPRALDHATLLLESEIEHMDLAASRFRSDSEVWKLSRGAGSPVRVTPLMLESVLVALAVAQWTDGAVDPTVGRCLEALGYDRDFASITRPDPRCEGSAPLASAKAAPGWQSIDVDIDNRAVTVPEGVLLDLGASAKALVADRAAAAIARRTDAGALVSIGGDIAVAGPPPVGGWAIGIATSSSTPTDSVDQVVAITEGGLASSSTTVREWRRGGRTVNHIVDPATGESATRFWTLVSVAASSCVEANAASTASIVWGPSAPKRLAVAALPARLVSVTRQVFTVCDWPGGTTGRHAPERVAS